MVRATNVASAATASVSGRNGSSIDPCGVERVRVPARGRRILALRQAQHFVVEKEDFEIDIAAQGVDEVVAADGQTVAVAGDDPHAQLRPDQFQAGRHGRRRPWIV